MKEVQLHPDYIFETSWEVCNKVGGIHTVLTSKALTLVNEWEDRLIMIGPDIWKGEGEHPEFKEDHTLLASWRTKATALGLKIKIGRWQITGSPVAILVDFTPFFSAKDGIFGDLWVRYKVDSLTGGWDYIEPALFGYAAGKVIECFYHHHLTFSDKIIAQFHEWITGVGVLYLNEHVPQIGTVFTTHATVVGRSIAGNGLPLYSKFDSYNADREARNFNVTAKHSLEKMAAQNSDCFTTVSEITAKECEFFLGKHPDIITPNGFEDFIVPDVFSFKEKRALARKKLLQVAAGLFGYNLPEDALLVIKSGRYEFRNKGIDIFIDALGELEKKTSLKKEVIAFIFVPAHSSGARKDLMAKLSDTYSAEDVQGHILTHYLQGADSDPILDRIKQNRLDNGEMKKVKVIYAPVYLNGTDGIFNLSYYELLIGFDISAFPSYYEPWGYTPLESLAFHIPTITTSLAGFGMMIDSGTSTIGNGVEVIARSDNNDIEAVARISAIIAEYAGKSEAEVESAREKASQLSKKALWKNFIQYYKSAYVIALRKADNRAHKFIHEANVQAIENTAENESPVSTEPFWRKIFVQSQFPENLKPLEKIVRNIWCTWDIEAGQLFEMVDSELWKTQNHNPIMLLDALPYTQIRRLEKNKEFVAKLTEVSKRFDAYMVKPVQPSPLVAYFCMEYGLCSNLKLYSGGLGILAGDYLKEASDSGVNMVGIGLLYRNGYFRQTIALDGNQDELHDHQKFTSLPLNPVLGKDDNWLKIGIAFPGRTLYAKIWRVDVGNVPLYLMDTDIPENLTEDRDITGSLYGGDWENRLKQELLLGIGGIRLLRLLDIKPEIYHYNEGHAAFGHLERMLMAVQEENVSYETAFEIVRSSSLFTTHTPVPAGHDSFGEDMLRIYISYYATLLNITWSRLMSLGKYEENNADEKFSMSLLALRCSQEINGVSQLHEMVSRRMFSRLWKGYALEELPIGHVTNGIHYPTWISEEWQNLYDSHEENPLSGDNVNKMEVWKKVAEIPDTQLWQVHLKLKKQLLDHLRIRMSPNLSGYGKNKLPQDDLFMTMDEHTFIIGFARRFVTYKRSSLLFYNQEKLLEIIKNCKFPILFLFAGKAHPNDDEGQQMIRNVIEISGREDFKGHVMFIQDYDMQLAKYMTRGVDVWLNTPEPEMEASGTSGMKAALNGIMNFSALDGWWNEAYHQDIGWTFSEPYTKENLVNRERLDAEMLYRTLQHDIIPLYERRDKDGIPVEWINKVKNAVMHIAPVYNTRRMLNEYMEKYYLNLQTRGLLFSENHFESARALASWKIKVTHEWNNIQIVSINVFDSANKPFPLGSEFNPLLILDINGLSPEDIGVEIVFINKRKDQSDFNKIIFKSELLQSDVKNSHVTYSSRIPIVQSGVYEYGLRVFPKNKLLKYRQDFPLLKWL